MIATLIAVVLCTGRGAAADNPCSPTVGDQAPNADTTDAASESKPPPPEQGKTSNGVPARKPPPRDGELPWDPAALRPISTGASTYSQDIGGAGNPRGRFRPISDGKEVSWFDRTYRQAYVLAGAAASSGYEDWLGSGGIALDARYIHVTTSRYLFGIAASYLRPFGHDRRALGFEVALGYGIWGTVHGAALGYYESRDNKDHLVRSARSGLFITGRWGNVAFGSEKRENGFWDHGPESLMLVSPGLLYDLRMRRTTLSIEGSAIYEANRALWGGRARALVAVRRYTAELRVTHISDYADQARIMVGRAF